MFSGLRVRVVGRLHRLFDERFDRRRGTETVTNVNVDELCDEVDLTGYESDNELYAGTPSLLFEALHAPLAGQARDDLTYIDIGCGKGRMLVQASEAGFGHVIGVEFAPRLAAMARANMQAALGEDNTRWQVDDADARTYKYPEGDIVLFLYNPFDPPVFELFLTNLLADLAERPRQLMLIYNHPICANILDTDQNFERVAYAGLNRAYVEIMNPHPCIAWRYVG